MKTRPKRKRPNGFLCSFDFIKFLPLLLVLEQGERKHDHF